MPLAVVLRSGVAPQRCPLSYTSAKVVKVLETTKTFANYFVKMQKVSHKVGHFKPLYNLSRERLLPKHFIRNRRYKLETSATLCIERSHQIGLFVDSEGVRVGSRNDLRCAVLYPIAEHIATCCGCRNCDRSTRSV